VRSASILTLITLTLAAGRSSASPRPAAVTPPEVPAAGDEDDESSVLYVSWNLLSTIRQILSQRHENLRPHERKLYIFLEDNVKDSAVDSVLFLVFDRERGTVSFLNMRTEEPVRIPNLTKEEVRAMRELCRDHARGLRLLKRNQPRILDRSQSVEVRAEALRRIVGDSTIPVTTKQESVAAFLVNARSELDALRARSPGLYAQVQESRRRYATPVASAQPYIEPPLASPAAAAATAQPAAAIPSAAPMPASPR